ncbi:hypothetical protein OEZ86_003314 [Tetradesmus obliquus]|nr:hypothetical protein OEZ86_003314 [Tetradesmus obliquus]
MNTIAVSAEDKRRFAIREPQPDCSKQVECGMYCPASPSQEHDDGGLVSDDLPDLPAYGLPAAATRLGDGSYLQAVDNDPYSMTAVEASDLQTAAEASDLQPLMDWICDSPAPTCAATLEPQQQQQQQQQLILPGAAAAGWSSQGLLNAAAPAMAPRTAQGAAAAKLNLGFTARFRGSAGAAAASSCVPVGNTSNASGSAEYAAAYTAGPAAQLAAFGGAAYAMQQPEEGAEEQQQEEQEEELQVQQARMSKRPRRPTQQQQQQQQDQDQAEHEQLEQQEAAELQLSPAQISQKRENGRRS